MQSQPYPDFSRLFSASYTLLSGQSCSRESRAGRVLALAAWKISREMLVPSRISPERHRVSVPDPCAGHQSCTENGRQPDHPACHASKCSALCFRYRPSFLPQLPGRRRQVCRAQLGCETAQRRARQAWLVRGVGNGELGCAGRPVAAA